MTDKTEAKKKGEDDSPSAATGSPTGWWNPQPFNARSKFHYIGKDGRSLCRKWHYLKGTIEEGQDEHSDNCATCKKKKLAMNAKAANQE